MPVRPGVLNLTTLLWPSPFSARLLLKSGVKASPSRVHSAVAQSIFSHCGRDLLEQWLKEVSAHLSDSGALVATFIGGAVDFVGSGWVYPGCVTFRLETMLQMSMSAGLRFRLLDWRHPRQHWALFAAPGFEDSWLAEKTPSWNTAVDSGVWNSLSPADLLSGLASKPSPGR